MLKKTGAYPAKRKQVRKMGFARTLAYLFGALLALCIIAAAAFHHWANTALSLENPGAEFVIAQGASLGQTVSTIQQAGVNVAEWPLKLLARYMDVATKLRPGTYQLQSPTSPKALLEKIARGDVITVDIVFPEGWTFRQIRARLDAHPGLKHDTTGLRDDEILRQLGSSEPIAEGLLFPDTYRVDKGASDLSVMRSAYRAMQRQLGETWNTRQNGLPLKSPYEALILASIIEKETGLDRDRPMIGSVFINRLRIGMPLQTDPTVIYGLGASFDGNLRKRDLTTDTPYNTYTRRGLPPSPIAMPSKASIVAALHPAESDMFYFVARGDTSSVFSSTLQSHNQAVNRYQRGIQ